MEYWIRTASVLLGLLAVSVQAMADTVVFPTDIPDFQDAVSSVSPGDTVLVETGNWSAGYTFLPSGITVASVSGDPYTTSLVGHLHVHDRDGIVLRGFRLSYGSSLPAISCVSSEILFEDVQLAYCGRIALYCESSDITFRSGLFYENLQGVRAEGSHLDFEDVSFRYNGHERSGAGLYALGSDVTMTRCRFSHNETGNFDYSNTWWAYLGTGGGALLKDGTSLTATDVIFDSNHTWQAGAGLALVGGGTHADISGGSFIDNTTSTDVSSNGALQKGAALFVDEATATLDGVWFSGNWCNRDGGAVYCEGGASVAATNCVFVENSAVHRGGAVYGPVDVSSCTFVDNAADDGSAMYASPAQFVYSSIICCTPEGASTAGVLFSHCCRWYSAEEETDGRPNIDSDPLFCDYEARDLTLCEDSPCLPDNNDWGELVGALGVGCGPCDTAVYERSWGWIKAMYRDGD